MRLLTSRWLSALFIGVGALMFLTPVIQILGIFALLVGSYGNLSSNRQPLTKLLWLMPLVLALVWVVIYSAMNYVIARH